MINIKNKEVYKRILYLGIPVALENLVYNFINFLDNFMVGQDNPALGLGTNAVSALGISNQIFFIFIVSLFGLFSGAGILSAQYFGNKEYEKLSKIFAILIGISLVLSLPFLIVGLFNPKLFILFFNKDPLVLKQAINYFSISCFSFPIAAIGFAFSMQLRIVGKSKFSFYSSLIGLFLNVSGNLLLIPIYGVKGAAIATVFARFVGLLFMIYIVYKFKLPIIDKFKVMFSYDINMIKKIFKISTPTFFHEVFWSFGMAFKSSIYSNIGADEYASIVVAITISSILFSMFSGVSNAASVIIGNELGANKINKAEIGAKVSIRLMMLLSIIASILLVSVSPTVLRLMNASATLTVLTTKVLYVEAILLILKSLNLLFIVGILRAGGDIVYAMILDIGGVWLISIPLTLLGRNLFFPIWLIYLLSGVEEVAKVIPSIFRYRKKKWLKRLV